MYLLTRTRVTYFRLIYLAISKAINETSDQKTNVIEVISLHDTSRQGIINSSQLDADISIRHMVIDEDRQLVWLSLTSNGSAKVVALHINGSQGPSYTISNPSADLAISNNGVVFYTTEASARIEWINEGGCLRHDPGSLDLIAGKYFFYTVSQC